MGAHSEGPGKGSEFTVWLPTVRRQGSDVPSPEVEEVRSEIRRRVLIVEDNADARESLWMLLEMQGHDVRSAQDGDTALNSRGIWALPATISSKAVKPKQRVSFDVMTSLNGEEAVNTEMLL